MLDPRELHSLEVETIAGFDVKSVYQAHCHGRGSRAKVDRSADKLVTCLCPGAPCLPLASRLNKLTLKIDYFKN